MMLSKLMALGTVTALCAAPASVLAYDVTSLSFTPSPSNDPPAQQVTQSTRNGKPTDKIFLPRNGKLQQFEFAAGGKFTGADIRRYQATNRMPMQVNYVDIRNRTRGVGIPPILFVGYSARRPISMSLFQGEVPMTASTKAGDPWKISGKFQLGCSPEGKVFGPVGDAVERLTGGIEFTGDGTYMPPVRIECEATPSATTPAPTAPAAPGVPAPVTAPR
jgi:hypothetical protein